MAPRVSQDLSRRNSLSRQEYDKILELHRSGVKATLISQRMQRSPACVSRVVRGKNQKFSLKT
jgi:IS30 family transposase